MKTKIQAVPKKDTHIEVLSHSISDLQSEVLWRFYWPCRDFML